MDPEDYVALGGDLSNFTIPLNLTKATNFQFPSPKSIPVTTGQIFAILGISVLAILCVGLNAGVLWAKAQKGWRAFTGFDLLVVNHLVINILVTVLADFWDLIAFMVVNNQFPFSERFCYFSRYVITFLPFMNSWNVVAMSLQQLVISMISFLLAAKLWNVPQNTTVRWACKLALPVVIWTFGGLHSIFTYTFWGIRYATGHCGADSLFVWLHESLGLVLVPVPIACVFLVAAVVLNTVRKTRFHVATPASGNGAASGRVSFHSSENVSPYAPYSNWNDNGYLPDEGYSGVNKDTEVLITADCPSSRTLNQSYVPESEDTVQSALLTTLALLVGVIVFLGPYGIITLLLDVNVRYKENWEFLIHIKWFDFIFPWALVKCLYEPIVIVALSPECRSMLIGIIRRRISTGRLAQ